MTLAESRPRSAPPLIRRLRADVEFLASPELEGRGTPSRGLDLAALYLESRVRSLGAKPAAGAAFRQVYRLGEYPPDEARVTVSVGGSELDSQDYVFWNISRDPAGAPFRLPLVNAGQGVVSFDRGVDDLAGLELHGAAVVVAKGAPWPLDPEKVFGPDRALGKIVAATVRGARMLVYLSDELDSAADEESRFFAQMKDATVSFLREEGVGHASALSPVLIVRPAAFERAFGTALESLHAGALDADLEVAVDAPVREASASNVVGVLHGTDPELRDEYVLLSAHYDHLGVHESAYHFARANTPFLFYFTGFHDDYHQPSDTPDKIRYPEMARIVESAADLARRYADGEPFPAFERPPWFITPPE